MFPALVTLGGQARAPAQDSSVVGAHQQIALDSTVVGRPVADPVIATVQWIFQRPPWVMWGGAILAGIVAALLLFWAWKRRAAIRTWLATRSRPVMAGLVAAVAVVVGLAAILGFRANDFMMNDPRFCTGCHIFVASGEAWVLPDTGYYSLVNKLEGKHDTLSCHDCHALDYTKEAVKMVYWMSGHREKEVPPHAKVPRAVCENCHVRGDAKETWQAIAATAGHRTHLESDSSALEGKVECLTCHAQTAHRFQPANATCAQRGCHEQDETRIRLGRMAQQTDLHCTSCHDFQADVPALATRDSAARALTPNLRQCTSCHQMERLVADFRPERDPHKAQCGYCHNPHTQTETRQAVKSCATAGCHADFKEVDFHAGAAHRGVAMRPERCATCHVPHHARVDASDCSGCHAEVRRRSEGRMAPPMPFDTAAALRRTRGPTSGSHRDLPPGTRRAPLLRVSSSGGTVAQALLAAQSPADADSFSHPRHRALACITCHSPGQRTSRITFERPRGCQICHHQAPARSRCAQCHQPAELADPMRVSLSVAVPEHQPRARDAGFAHPPHREVACTQCHTSAVTLAPPDSIATCAACHAQHHTARAACATCHRTGVIRSAHEPAETTHTGCDACHTLATVAALTPTRPLCLTCHAEQTEHYAERECSVCHFQRSPAELRAHLRRGGTGA